MISNFSIKKVASYDQEAQTISELTDINFFFGSNGVGKTTISRLLRSPSDKKFTDCQINWSSSQRPRIDVFNRDFVVEHFDSPSSIKGIYTLGEGNAGTLKDITELKVDCELLQKAHDVAQGQLTGFSDTIGDEGAFGKRAAETKSFKNAIWESKKILGELSTRLKNINTQEKLYNCYMIEAEKVRGEVRSVAELNADCLTAFDDNLTAEPELDLLDGRQLHLVEQNEIVGKVIVGKENVAIAHLVQKLQNSDWVQGGIAYLENSEDSCPFCQQKLPDTIRGDLEAYFDENFMRELGLIKALRQEYQDAVESIERGVTSLDIGPSQYLDRDELQEAFGHLQQIAASNIAQLSRKISNPSAVIVLVSTKEFIDAINSVVDGANTKNVAHNDTLKKQGQRRIELIEQIWTRLLKDTQQLYSSFNTSLSTLNPRITGLDETIKSKADEIRKKEEVIRTKEGEITDIKHVIHAINSLLRSYGFEGFKLQESESRGFYQVVRPGGELVEHTLSEGEKSFITFLYFYHLIKGSFAESGASEDRIIVLDDPVSSLDADVLCIVANLIRDVIDGMRGSSQIKQVFVLTHNAYFHQQVTFQRKSKPSGKTVGRAFWLVRKQSGKSVIAANGQINPVKSSYDLLWNELRKPSPSSVVVQNVMRRILEHYLKLYSGLNFESLVDRFEGSDKQVCQTLISWLHDGSHSISDDINIVVGDEQVERYLRVFHLIFSYLDQEEHYKTFMGDAYIPLPEKTPEIEVMA